MQDASSFASAATQMRRFVRQKEKGSMDNIRVKAGRRGL